MYFSVGISSRRFVKQIQLLYSKLDYGHQTMMNNFRSNCWFWIWKPSLGIKIKKYLLLLLKILILPTRIGIKNSLHYVLADSKKLVSINLNKRKIYIRKSSPDIKVLYHSLFGELDILKKYCPKNYSGLIIDAGGYIGTTAIALRELFPNSKIIVLEPSGENLYILKKNLAGIKNIKIIHGALVGKKIKSVALQNIFNGQWGFTVVKKTNSNFKIIEKVPAYTLSQLLGKGEKIGILKLDIEGGEYGLIKNDSKTLSKIDYIYAELHDEVKDNCSKIFFQFSKKRTLIKDRGEKYLSVSNNITQ